MAQTIVLKKASSVILKGQTVGSPAVTRGMQVRFVSIPHGMTGSYLKFTGSIDGFGKFYLRKPTLVIVSFTTDVLVQPDFEKGTLEDIGQVMPFGEEECSRGVMMIQAVSDKKEAKDQTIDFYYEEE
jgi:hypothetical protein